jgi:hypothetical protein
VLDLLPCQQNWRLFELLRTAQEGRFDRRIVTKAGGSAGQHKTSGAHREVHGHNAFCLRFGAGWREERDPVTAYVTEIQ